MPVAYAEDFDLAQMTLKYTQCQTLKSYSARALRILLANTVISFAA